MLELQQIKNVYFLGIGGIGMSALAFFFLEKGKRVYGYDRLRTPLCVELEEKGAQIHYTEEPSAIPADTDLFVYTPAIPADHAEWELIRASGKPLYKRAQLLGELSRNYKTVAVAGSHGKTTTSSMITHLLMQAGGCNAFLGGISKSLNGNYVSSDDSPYMVVEADEFDRSFLQLRPYYEVITSMDPDHLDIYGTEEHFREAFVDFARLCDPAGMIILKDKLLPFFTSRLGQEHARILPYALLAESSGARADRVRIDKGAYVFDFVQSDATGLNSKEIRFSGLRLNYPGLHNVENAVAAVSAAVACGVSEEHIRSGLESFQGVKRRFDYRIRTEERIYMDDYAHHPGEIAASLHSLKDLYPDKKLTVAFQPHLYTRTRDFAKEFAQSLSLADDIILLDIYPARECPIEGVSSRSIGEFLSSEPVYTDKSGLLNVLKNRPWELLVSMGAGDIDQLVQPIEEAFR